MKKNRVCELLNLKYPIFQGAMAWISESKLASAVSEAGGLGIIAGAAMDIEELEKNIKEAKALTDKNFGVNLMMQREDIEDQINLCIREKVKVVTTGAGNPTPFMPRLKEAGIIVIPVVPSLAIAKKMEKIGSDAVIVEGMESGGHIGKTTTMSLLSQITSELKIPVIAAGGIANGSQYLASLAMGAEGIQCGTIFLTAKECIVHENYKKAILDARDMATVVTGTFSGHPVRVIKNAFADKILELEKNGKTNEIDEFAKGSYSLAAKDGDIQNGSIMAGQVASIVSEEKTAKEILETLDAELKNAYENLLENIKHII